MRGHSTRLFLRCARGPDRGGFDAAYDSPLRRPAALISATPAGSYYVLVTRMPGSAGTSRVSLQAELLTFRSNQRDAGSGRLRRSSP